MTKLFKNIQQLKLIHYITFTLFGYVAFATFYPLISKDFLVIATILWLKFIDYNKLKYLLQNKTIQFFLLFFIYNSITYIWTPDKKHYFDWILDNFYFFLLPMILIATTATEKTIKLYIKIFLFIMFANEIISYGIFFHLWLSFKDDFPIYFMFHIPYSVILSMTILITYYELLSSQDNIFLKIIYSIFLVTMLGNLVLSGGRTGQITLLASTIIFLVITSNKQHKKHIGITFIVMSLLLSVSFFTYPQFQKRTAQIYTETMGSIENQNFNTSIGNRLLSYVLVQKFIADKDMIFGEGTGSKNIIKNQLIDKYFPHKHYDAYHHDHLHEYYLDTFFEVGLVGIILFVLFIYHLSKSASYSKEMKNIKVILIIVLLISSLFDRILLMRSAMLIFALFIGLIIASDMLVKEKNQYLPRDE